VSSPEHIHVYTTKLSWLIFYCILLVIRSMGHAISVPEKIMAILYMMACGKKI